VRTLGDVGEFGLIGRIAALARAARVAGASVAVGIGDDAAVLRLRAGEEVVVTTDALVEGVHFRFDQETARVAGRRALAANLSDVAAMGARPLGFVVALAAPPSTPLARALGLARGMLDLAKPYACPLVGGNVASAREVSVAITVLGAVGRGRALLRSAARVGDRVFVTGTLGGAALERARGRVRRAAEPRLAAGLALARLRGAGACIDISDGLAADLGHVARASRVRIRLEAERLPLPAGFAAACARAGRDPWRLAWAGGEDYELAFSARPAAGSAAALARRLGVRVTEIGRVVAGSPGLEGLPRALGTGGFRHF
jgi:thiamine-monophosphate kinase